MNARLNLADNFVATLALLTQITLSFLAEQWLW